MKEVKMVWGGGTHKSNRLKSKKRTNIIIGVISILIAAISLPLGVSAIKNIFISSNQIIDIQVGSDKIDQVYIGSKLVWERCDQQERFDYTGGAQAFTATCDGYYQIELWGAQGGPNNLVSSPQFGGYGGYVSGRIYLQKNETLYVYVGQSPLAHSIGGYNGGGAVSNPTQTDRYGGGGATDVRLVSGLWNNTAGLRSRIMVAGAGGGLTSIVYAITSNAGPAGGLVSENSRFLSMPNSSDHSTLTPSTGATQTSGGTGGTNGTADMNGLPGAFGIGANSSSRFLSGGGGGYYGGASAVALSDRLYTATGGSSYISGHTGAVAITSATDQTPKSGCTTSTTNNACSTHYSGKTFINTKIIDGNGYAWTNTRGILEPMSNPNGGYYATGTGHISNGVAKITFISRTN